MIKNYIVFVIQRAIAIYKMFFNPRVPEIFLLFRIESFLPTEINVNIKRRNKIKSCKLYSSCTCQLKFLCQTIL